MTDEPGVAAESASDWLLETEQQERRPRRPPLSRGEIVAAAMRIIDTDGVEALSMRRLGEALGVRAMAMYRHLRDKSQLLDLVIEGVLRDVAFPPVTGAWREDAAAVARAARAGMMRHRHAVSLLSSRPWVGPAGLLAIDHPIGIFRRAGMDDRLAIQAQFTLANYVTGFCAWESANLGAPSDEPAARARVLARFDALVAAVPVDRYPNLVAVAGELTAGTLDQRFEAGLGIVLDGLQAALERSHPG